jgi:pyruvate dehydrogenase E1 component alpha subunit
VAWAAQLRGQGQVVLCFFGDGASKQGAFHESLNLASLWKLPVLFLCENNLYAMGTALARHQAQTDITLKAAGYAIEAEAVDGMDVLAVEAAARRASDRVRGEGRPVLLELRTYRFRAHSMYDPDLYRSKDEIEAWKQRDPIRLFTARLEQEGLLTQPALEEMERTIAQEISAALAYADSGPLEPTGDLLKDVYSPLRQ